MWRADTTDLKVLTERAQNAINSLDNDKEKQWFSELLDILKEEKMARIQLIRPYPHIFSNITCTLVDVTKIAHTTFDASFFDIFNHKGYVNFNINPVITDKFEYRLI